MKTSFLLLSPCFGMLLSSIAFAQEAPPAVQLSTPPAQPGPAVSAQPEERPPAVALEPHMDLSTAAVSAPIPRTYHFHEGFYLRASVGFGSYAASYTDRVRPNRNFDEDGASMAVDLLIGGSPSPGISVGGGLLLEPLFSDKGGVSMLIGPFVDGFPNTTGGWHLGGMIGLAGQSFQNVNTNDKQTAAGIGGAAWFGYDFWVANEWSIGPQLRLTGMRTGNTKSGEDISAYSRSITVGMSVLFN